MATTAAAVLMSCGDGRPRLSRPRRSSSRRLLQSTTPRLLSSLPREIMRTFLLALCLASATTLAAAQQYDLVLAGGRVIDPETRLDAVRNVGIRDGTIARVTTVP